MRYNPWIEVDRAGPAARRKAYSGGRLRAPINRQFIALQALDAAKPCHTSYLAEYERFLQSHDSRKTAFQPGESGFGMLHCRKAKRFRWPY